MSLKQKKIKFKPRTKLNHNKYINNISYIVHVQQNEEAREEEQGMVKWWEPSPPTNMWPRFKFRHWCHIWVEFVVGSLLYSKRFFSRHSGFPLSSETSISKFQFDQDLGRRRTTLWMYLTSKSLFILFYSFKNLNAKKIIAALRQLKKHLPRESLKACVILLKHSNQ